MTRRGMASRAQTSFAASTSRASSGPKQALFDTAGAAAPPGQSVIRTPETSCPASTQEERGDGGVDPAAHADGDLHRPFLAARGRPWPWTARLRLPMR